MGTAPRLNKTLRTLIERQHVFFVATAAHDGRVNVSPKGASIPFSYPANLWVRKLALFCQNTRQLTLISF
jgi:hypothetical protein